MRKDLDCMKGVLAGFSILLVRHRFTLLMSVLAEFSLGQNDPCGPPTRNPEYAKSARLDGHVKF